MKNLPANKVNLFSKQVLLTFLKNKKETILHTSIVFCVPVLLYLSTIGFGFTCFDDNEIITNNITFLSDCSNATPAFLTDAFLVKSSHFYRPLQTISYMADICLSGGNYTWMYHLTNILLLGLISCLLFLLLRKFLIPTKLAILSTLIYCAHPLFISAVAWIPSRGDLLLTFFSLLSFLFFIEYLQKREVVYLLLNWLAFTIALFCKETAAFLPFLFIMYYIAFSTEKRFEKTHFLSIVLYAISGILWFWLRSIALKNSSDLNEYGLMPLIANVRIIPESLANLLLPFDIALIPRFSFLRTIIGLGIIVAIVILFVSRKGRSKKEKVFCLSWFLLLLLPTMFYKTEFIDYLNHRFFLPLLGILLFILFNLPKKWFEKKAIKSSWLIIGLLIFLSTITFVKARMYSDPITFWNTTIFQNPENVMNYINRGYLKVGGSDYQGAIEDFTKVIELKPTYAIAYNNRGTTYSAIGNLEWAIKDFDKAIELSPNYVVAYNNRGSAYKNKGDLDRAIKDFDKAVELNPHNADACNNLGNVYKDKGDLNKAIKAYDKAIALNPYFAGAYYNRATAYCINGKLDRGIDDFNTAIGLNPNEAETYNNRGTAYRNKGYLEMAINDYNKAIELNPNYADAYNNRGSVYKAMGMMDRAEQDFKMYEALKMNK
jgi:tetratricopeptide (TPR) repeat protein